MARYNEVITLIGYSRIDSGIGSYECVESSRIDVFANRYSVSAAAFMQARAAGLHCDAEYSIRSCDYNGETAVEVDGVEYEVERVSDNGEFTRLTLARRLSNA